MRLTILAFILVAIGCSNDSKPIHPSFDYLPPFEYLKDGVVSKYYYHRGKDNAQVKTDIFYRKIVLNDNILNVENFNAAFERNYVYSIRLEENIWKLIDEKSISYRNSFTDLLKEYSYVFEDNIVADWENNDASVIKTVEYENFAQKILTKQIGSRDLISEGQKVKAFSYNREIQRINEEEESEPIFLSITKEYQENLGQIHSLMVNDEFKYESVLDEVMTLEEFERKSNHGTHRVGYIDTLQTIDDHTLFQPCYHPSKINDYYNDQRSGFTGGKGRLRAILRDQLDHTKIAGESGYLTFRFVINCEGEAGWFVTEEADLDYQKKAFSKDCKMHLYDILKSEEEWVSLYIRKEARDAYTYITIKIKDGEIIEILP